MVGTTATAQVTHLSKGFAGAVCSRGAACTASSACHIAAMGCTTGTPVCADAGNVADGTACGTGRICSTGACVDPFRVIGAYWTGSQEELDAIDPASASPTKLGVIGDLASWNAFGHMVASRDGSALYAFGNTSSGMQKFYAFSINAGSATSTVATNPANPFICCTNAAGTLVVIYWTGSQEAVDEFEASYAAQTRKVFRTKSAPPSPAFPTASSGRAAWRRGVSRSPAF